MSIEITTNDILDVCLREDKCGNKKPPIFLAWYGLGKSYQLAKFAKQIDAHYIDYRAAYKTFNDVRGFGVPDRESGLMRFLRDEDFDFVEGRRNVLHLEELLNAQQVVQKPLMQVMLDRRIGKFLLPEGTFICASSNRRDQKTGVETMLGAFADRVSIYLVRPDLQSFMDWYEANGESPEVFAFLSANPSAPYDFDLKEWKGETTFPTFRSFERLGELVASYDSPSEAANDSLFRAMAVAKVGPKHGEMFAQFIKLTSKVGDVGRMLDDADRCAIPKETDLRWLIACRTITLANPNNVDNVLTLAHRLTDPDMDKPDTLQAMESFVGNSIRRRRKDLLRSSAMVNWQLKHADELTTV